jgi:signal transduction histidine kinase
MLIVFFSSCTSKTADKNEIATNDSIKKYLDLAGNDSLDFKLRNQYNDKAFRLINLSRNDTLTRFYIYKVSFNYNSTAEFSKWGKASKIHFTKSMIAKDTLNLARYCRSKATFFRNTNGLDSAFYYYVKAEKFYKKTNDKLGLARVYFYKSKIQVDADDYLGAQLSVNLAYSYYKKKPADRFTLRVLTMQGMVFSKLQEYNKAIEKYEECIYNVEKYHSDKKDFNFKRTCLNNIGNVYREQKKFYQAISYFKSVLSEKKLKYDDCELYAMSLNNIGYCYMQLNNNHNLSYLFIRAGKILDSIGNKNEYMISNLFTSQFYLKKKDTLKAQFYAEIALKTAKKTGASYYYLTALSNAGSIDSKKAPKFIKEYHEKNDSLLFIERNARNQYFNIQLETNEIIQDKQAAIKQKWIMVGISGIVIIIIVLLLIITRQRSKQKDMQLMQSQQKANEEIYGLMLVQKNNEELARQGEKKRIALELHDGVMNKLASTRLNLDILHYKKDKQTIGKCLKHIKEIYQIEQEIRSIAHDLNQEVFMSKNSFVTIIKDFIATQNSTSRTIFTLEIDESIDWNTISSEIKMNLFRIIQEASRNINKFAQARNAVVSLLLDEEHLCLSITDNGNGFDIDMKTDGIGLKNIKQRIESLNGKLFIQSKNNISTSINIAIPIA